MSIADLAQQLRTAAAGGTVTLNAATLTTGTGLTLPSGFDALVTAALGLATGTNWTLQVQASQIPDPTSQDLVITAGTSTLAGLNLTTSQVDLRFNVPDGTTTLQLTASFALPTDWTVATSFPTLTGYPFDSLQLTSPALIFAAQEQPYAAPAGSVTLAPGLNFAAQIALNAVFGPIQRFLSAGSTYLLSGTIDPSASTWAPAVALTAPLSGALAPLGPLQISAPFLILNVNVDATKNSRSTVLAYGVSLAAGDSFAVDFTTQLLPNTPQIVFSLAAPADHPMTPDAVFALVGGQSWGDAVPGPLRSALQMVAFKDLNAWIGTASPPTLDALAVTVGSTQPIQVFDGMTIDSFDVQWWIDLSDSDLSELTFAGEFAFLPSVFPGTFDIVISSNMQIWGGYTDPTGLSLAKLLSQITNGFIPAPGDNPSIDLTLNEFQVALDIPGKSYALSMAGGAVFDPLGTGLLRLANVELTLASAAATTGRTYSADLSASLLIAGLPLAVSADYATGEGWNFAAAMPPGTSVTIQSLLQSLYPGAGVPDFLAQVSVKNLQLKAHVGGTAPGSIAVGATVSLNQVDLGLLGTYTIDADLALAHTGGATPVTTAGFMISTVVPAIGARVGIGYSFSTQTASTITVVWGAFTATYNTQADQIRFNVGEATLGGVLGQIVGLVIGDDGYRLPPPWSVLDEISLKGFTIIWDLKANTVELDYSLPSPIDLGILTINGLSIQKKDSVTVTLDATFVGGEKVPPFDPLEGPPPAPGGSPIDLRLLALGQRVKPSDTSAITSVDQAIQVLASFTNPPSGGGIPVGPTFAADVPWLAGLHLLVMSDTVEIEIVFIDPILYGARIHLAGEKAGPFAGLDFEILYRRITDTIGVYQIRLKLPDAMRTLQFGALAITLPDVGVDIYTNGDFRIDFGFPANMDFSRSFGIQYFPFTGAGGFYFAKLSGATQTSIGTPSIAGTFDPVIEFGLGLQLGVGKDLSAGILSAGVSLTVFGIVEGVIARWVPGTTSLPAPAGTTLLADDGNRDVGQQYYYKISGTIGIIGKIYGSIDFAIIKASLNLTVTIALQAVIEAHQPLLIAFIADVSVSLTVSINLGLFKINIHLSFSMTVRESFTLGSVTAAPWGTLTPIPPKMLRQQQRLAARPLLHGTRDFRALGTVADDARVAVNLAFAMHPTVAGDPADASTTQAKLVAMLYLDAPDPTAPAPPLPPLNVPLPDAPTSFERFAEAVFLWAAAAFGSTSHAGLAAVGDTILTRTQIDAAYAWLTDPANTRPVSYDQDIVPGLFPHLVFNVAAGGTIDNGSVFPMIPDLALAGGQPFSQGLQVDDTYLAALTQFFAQVAPRYRNPLEQQYDGSQPATAPAATPPASFTTVIFEDIVAMLARGMLKGACDTLDAFAWSYAGEALADIVAALDAAGNTLTAGEIGAANATVPLTATTSLPLPPIAYQFAATDSFASVVKALGVTDPAAVLQDPLNATQNAVIRPGATLTGSGGPYVVVLGDSFGSIAGMQGWSFAQLATALLAAPDAIRPLAMVCFAAPVVVTGAADTIETIGLRYGLAKDAVAESIAAVPKLFAGTPVLAIPDLEAVQAGWLLGRMRTGEVAAHLAGANARFLLNGARPPAPPTAPNPGQPAALYELNGQQIDVPSNTQVTLSIAATQPWIAFAGGGLSVTYDAGPAITLAANFTDVVQASGVPAAIDTLAPLPDHQDTARRFTLRQTAPVQASEPLPYPFAGTGAGAPRLWFIPDAMAASLTEPKALPSMFGLEATSDGSPPQTSDVTTYGWATVVDIEVKRRTDLADTYDVFGSNEAGTALLGAMITPGSAAQVAAIRILTGANATGQAPSGYVDPGLATRQIFLVKTNLSTDTNPTQSLGQARLAAAPPTHGILNAFPQFLQLLWEASVTRNGGFALTYRADDGSGLPDSLFAGSDSATISLLMIHQANGATVHPSANAVLVGDGFDPAHYNLAAVSQGQPASYAPTGMESLADIVADYRILLSDLGDAAAGVAVAPGATIAIAGIVHQVAGATKTTPAETLAWIAQIYGLDPQAIVTANPGIQFSPLAPLTLLNIPDLTRPGSAYPNFGGFASAFGLTPGALAAANATTPGLFASGSGPIAFTDQWIDRVPALPPGNVGFALCRANPGTGTDAATVLATQFNLLHFELSGNLAFNATVGALPIGPTKQGVTATRQMLHAMAGDDWEYDQTLYVADAAIGDTAPGPYRGADSHAQLWLAFGDMFGNLAASALTQPSLAPPQPLNDTPLPVACRDAQVALGGWPALGIDYGFLAATGGPALALAFSFDTSRYQGAGSASTDPQQMPAWQTRALADAQSYATIAQQLAMPGVTIGVATSLDGGIAHALDLTLFSAFATAAAAYLNAVGAGSTTPPPIPSIASQQVPVAATNTDDLFALTVSLTLARPAAVVAPAFRGTPAESVTSTVQPQQAVQTGATEGALAAFATAFELAYTGDPVFLKLLVGQSQRSGSPDSGLWVGRFRTAPGNAGDPGIGFKVDPTQARYYAPRPLANVRISRGDVPIVRYDPQTGIDWTDPVTTAFNGVAMDSWGRTALAALDRFLSPDFAGATFLVDHFDPAQAGFLAKILQLKSDFAQNIAQTVTPILQTPAPPLSGTPEALDAIAAMRQQILARAENSYTIAALAQFAATVSSPYPNDPTNNVYAPRFYGAVAGTPQTAEGNTGVAAQPWSFTVARPALSAGQAFVTTAMTVTETAAQAHLPLDLDFQLTHVEHDITRGVDGEYLASSWLAFVIPFTAATGGQPMVDTTIGVADIPVPDRDLPSPPSLTAQAATQVPITSTDPAGRLEQAKRWTYGFTYQKDLVAQDTIDCTVLFNTSDADPNPGLMARPLDLFDYLARFVTVWPAMIETMTALLVPSAIPTDPTSTAYQRIHTLISDFYTLLQPMPAAWVAWHATLQRAQRLGHLLGAAPYSTYGFSVQESRDGITPTSPLLAQLTLGDSNAQLWDPTQGKNVPLPPPALQVDDPSGDWAGTSVSSQPLDFTFQRQQGGQTQTLAFDTAVEQGLRSRTPEFLGLGDGLDIAAYQNAWAAVQVFRNRDLVQGVITTPDFVFATPEVRFASRAVPLIDRSGDDFDIAALSTPPQQPLAAHLGALAALLFEGTAPDTIQSIRLDAEFQQSFNPNVPPAVVPLTLGVPWDVTATKIGTQTDLLADYIVQWFADQSPGDGTLCFGITMFPTLTGGRVPLLRMPNLWLARANVSDL